MRTIADHILDIAQNSVRAGAGLIEIIVCENNSSDIYRIEVIDNGKGMDAETLSKINNPFFTSRKTRRVGLGIPLLKQAVEQTGGNLRIFSGLEKGTLLMADFVHSHIDRPIMGDVATLFVLLYNGHPGTEFSYRHRTPKGEFFVSTTGIKEALEVTDLRHKPIRDVVYGLINNGLENISANL